MDAIEKGADRLAQGLALIGAIGLLVMLVHVAADVATRNLAARPIPATNEIVSRYWMVLITFLPLAWVERSGAMVKVEVFDMIAGRGLSLASDLLVAALSAAVYGVLAWVTWQEAAKAMRIGSFVDVMGTAIPTWPSTLLPPAGLALAALAVLVRAAARIADRPA